MAAPGPAGGEYLERDHFEALVIGSGFGGAVAVCRLAQAGVDVAVVERGRRWPPGSFPRDLSRLDDGWLWLCNHGLYDALPLGDILAVRAAGFGGGSLVYANVAVRSPDEVFDDRWPAPYTRQALDPYYDLASHMLDVRPVPADPRSGELPSKTKLMARAAERLGHTDGFFHPNLAVTFTDDGPEQTNQFGVAQRGCVFCGECDIGCNVGAKNTLDLNYLALAQRHGAAVGTRTEAVHLARTGDGYRILLREYGRPGAGRDGTERSVTARYVFVCAGALGSTELLLRSRDQYRTLPDLPPALGSRFSGNGDFLGFGHGLREPFEPASGPTITTASLIRSGTGGAEHWFVLEDGGYSPQLARLVRTLDLARLPAYVARFVSEGTQRVLAASRHLGDRLDDDTAVLLAMGRDGADGRITLKGPRHRLSVTWDVPGNDPLYAEEQAACGALIRSFGGRPFVTPTWRLFRQPVTVHNLGGAAMAADPTTGVVDPDGEVFGHPGLYVLDGAILPAATGGNPSLTVAAVAERCIEVAVRRITGDGGWTAPERAAATRRAVPEDDAVRAVVARGPRPNAPAPRGVRFSEVMRGAVRLEGTDRPAGPDVLPVVLRLDVHVPDLSAFLDDPVHAAQLTGTVTIGGLTAGPAPVRAGTLHLLAPVEEGHGRSMNYLLPFADRDGGSWLLQGTKRVRRGDNPWRATTVLQIALTTPEERYEGTVPTGRLTISFPDTLRLVSTVRATGVRGLGAAHEILRFGAFFSGHVARAVLG